MRLLVLGGTAFLGRAVAQHAVDAGVTVTCLARGSSSPPPGVDFVTADRDDDAGLAAVAGQSWDAVVDVSSQPGQVRRAVRDLRTEHWVFVSSGNVYKSFSTREPTETAAIREPLDKDVMDTAEDYGPAKVACETTIMNSGRSWTVIRSGLIAGPGDRTGRVGYYPWRFAHPTGEDVLVPGDVEFPCAMIDVDDLAAWTVHCAASRVHGTFNATGTTTALGEVLETARSVAKSPAVVRPVPVELLQREGIQPWTGPRSLPLWIDDPLWREFMTLDTTRAREAGLRTRPLREVLERALAFELIRDQPRAAGLTDAEERELRDALTAQGGSS